MSSKAPPAKAPAPAAKAPAGKSPGPHVQLVDDGHHDGAKVKKVLTTKYNMEQLKKITEFDMWVDDEMGKLSAGKTTIELDFDEWDSIEPPKQKAYLEGKLNGAGLADSPARKKFIDEYNKRGALVQKMLRDPSLHRTASGSKLQ